MADKTKATEPRYDKRGKLLKQIGVSLGVTVNLGDFESARVDVWEQEWTTEEDKEEKYAEIWKSVEKQVRKEIDSVTGASEEEEEPKKKKKKKTSR